MTKKALIVVDVQNDFLPNGALHVPGGDEILPIIDALVKLPFDCVVASRDYHPANHLSFASQHPQKVPGDRIILHGLNQILWPDHCVQGTHGSEFAKGWDSSRVDHIVLKGTNREYDSYSTFFDNEHIQSTGLDEYLKKNGITDVYLAGLATDYCVKYSALDAFNLGYNVFVIQDACRGVNLEPNDVALALDDLRSVGVKLIHYPKINFL